MCSAVVVLEAVSRCVLVCELQMIMRSDNGTSSTESSLTAGEREKSVGHAAVRTPDDMIRRALEHTFCSIILITRMSVSESAIARTLTVASSTGSLQDLQ